MDGCAMAGAGSLLAALALVYLYSAVRRAGPRPELPPGLSVEDAVAADRLAHAWCCASPVARREFVKAFGHEVGAPEEGPE